MGSEHDKESLTQFLLSASDCHGNASVKLFEVAYGELKKLAHHKLKHIGSAETLNTTSLVHEAYIKLFNHGRLEAENRAHFFALCAKIMRQILVDHYRKKSAEKRGGNQPAQSLESHHVSVDSQYARNENSGEQLLDLDAALGKLEKLNSRLSTVIECKFFVAMRDEEIASYLGVTDRTVRNDWRKARMWLSRELATGDATVPVPDRS